MNTSYVLSPEAEQDLHEILHYIAQDNVVSARKVICELQIKMEELAESPGVGHLSGDLADESLRVWPIYSYLIVYRFEVKPIQIVRVLHGARDIINML